MPSLKLSRKINKSYSKGYILITTASYPRYFFCHYSVPVAGQFLKILNDVFNFITNLDNPSTNSVKIKLDSIEYGWNIKERFVSKGFSNLLSENNNFYKLLSKSRLSVSTYNSTIYYETLSANFPTIIFFDQHFYEISKDSEKDFNLLKSVGIYHESPFLAAKFVNSIFNNINEWWFKKEVQYAREHFCRKYAFKSKTYLRKWKYSFYNLAGK